MCRARAYHYMCMMLILYAYNIVIYNSFDQYLSLDGQNLSRIL